MKPTSEGGTIEWVRRFLGKETRVYDLHFSHEGTEVKSNDNQVI
jgi:hypothetical protein